MGCYRDDRGLGNTSVPDPSTNTNHIREEIIIKSGFFYTAALIFLDDKRRRVQLSPQYNKFNRYQNVLPMLAMLTNPFWIVGTTIWILC